MSHDEFMQEDLEQFKEEFRSQLQEELESRGHTVNIDFSSSFKANEQVENMTVRLDDNPVAPSLHPDQIYSSFQSSDLSMKELANMMADQSEEALNSFKDMGFDPKDFNADYVREHSHLVVVNTDMNKELLSRVPHEQLQGTDLSYYAKVRVGDSGSITINNDHAAQLKMTRHEILETARQNTLNEHFDVKSLQETITGMMPEEIGNDGFFPFPEQTPSTVVITSESMMDGANALLSPDALDKACELMKCDEVVILPSSRHELLAVNSEQMASESTADLKHMVEEVNASSAVSSVDYLSDNIYKYDSNTHSLEMCDENGMFNEHDDPSHDIDHGMSR